MKNSKITQWIPGIVAEVVAVIFCIIYAVIDGSKVTMYIELPGAALLAFLIPAYNVVAKKSLPTAISVACAIFVFLACCLGTAMDFYHKIWFYDLAMHGVSGFLCCAIIFMFIMDWNGSKLSPMGCLVTIFGFSMGVAALWEVMEYASDFITGGDAQRVLESMAAGKSPISDTMEDIIAALVGSLVFFAAFFADKLAGYKVLGKLCGFTGFETDKDVRAREESGEAATDGVGAD